MKKMLILLVTVFILVQCGTTKSELAHSWAIENVRFDYGINMISLSSDDTCVIPPVDSTVAYIETTWSLQNNIISIDSDHKYLGGQHEFRFLDKRKMKLELRKKNQIIELTRL